MVKIWKPYAMLTGSITMMPFDEPSGYLARLADGLRGITIFAGGILTKAAGLMIIISSHCSTPL